MRNSGSRLGKQDAAAAFGFGLLSLAVSHACYFYYFNGGETYEFCHYAEIARNILAGHGFRTGIFTPMDLATLEFAGKAGSPLAPVVGSRYPLFALWSAFWMLIGGVRDYGMALGGMAGMALSAAAVYGTGARFFGRRAGALSAGLWCFLPTAQAGYVLGGYSEPLFVALLLPFLARFILTMENEGLRMRSRALGLGAFAGLLYLLRPNSAFWLPVFLALPVFWGGREGMRFSAFLAGGFAAVAVPWTLYYAWLTGRAANPVLLEQLAAGTIAGPQPRMELGTFGWADFAAPAALWKLGVKSWVQLRRTAWDLAGLGSMPVLAAAAVAGFFRAAGAPRRFIGAALILLGVSAVCLSVLHYEVLVFMGHRHYFWFGAVVVVGAGALLAEGLGEPRGRALAAAILLCQAQFIAYQLGRRGEQLGRRGSSESVAAWAELGYIRDRLPRDAAVLTNIPTQVGWYAGRTAIHFPFRLGSAAGFADRWKAPYLLVSLRPLGELFRFPEWAVVFNSDRASAGAALRSAGYVLEREFPGAVLLKRQG
ncbi:MAG: hypothetical protein A2X36_02650 [Elusimicrobia bacterium GWA2_69_24]|nr:MAG: hypothetical protein A2X36_02650 [Elusimicrobia bacterium GWA2_69_24]HBL15562.1 hypothetical protein [Elusimicrobiota bacterium]